MVEDKMEVEVEEMKEKAMEVMDTVAMEKEGMERGMEEEVIDK